MTGDAPDEGIEGALDGARQAFLQHVEERRLRLFRSCLQASVRWASPLSVSFARYVGLTLDEILQVVVPPTFWPQSTGSLEMPSVRWILPAGHASRGGTGDRLMRRVARTGGHVMRVGGGGDWVGWRVSGDCVEVAASLGAGVLVTNCGILRLWIPGVLPATVCAAVPGRQLSAFVHHPLLAGEDLIVASIDDRHGGHELRVRTGCRRFAPPWPDHLAGLQITHGGPSIVARYMRDA